MKECHFDEKISRFNHGLVFRFRLGSFRLRGK